jgi:Mg/Co/Ni transporter MgtE
MMSLQKKVNLYDCLCAALRKPLSQGGYIALTAALQSQPAEEIATVVEMMSNDEALAIFNWLDDWRASQMLQGLRPEQVQYLLHHAPAGRLSRMAT